MRIAQLPDGLRAVRRTPDFTVDSVPPGLLSAHTTTVWAQLVVTSGSVVFVDEEDQERAAVRGGVPMVIVPHRRHHIEPEPDAEFFVQFFDVPEESES
jgi:tellurite resistance-related uncharacterized protein